MSRYRKVHTLIWNDNKFPFANDDAQLVWFHAFTNPFTTRLGIYMASLEALAANKRWTLDRYRIGMGICIENSFLTYDDRYHVVHFPQFFKWNKPDNPKHFIGLMKAWDDIPICGAKKQLYQQLKELCADWGPGYVDVLDRYAIGMGIGIGNVSDTGEGKGAGKGAGAGAGKGPKKEHPPPPHFESGNGKQLPACPVDQIISAYRQELPRLRSPSDLNAKRKQMMESTWFAGFELESRNGKRLYDDLESGIDAWRKLFIYIRDKCKWLMKPENGFVDLDWICQRDHFIGIIEGKYEKEWRNN